MEEVRVEDRRVDLPEEPDERRHAEQVQLRPHAEHVDRDPRVQHRLGEGAVDAAHAPEGEDVRLEAGAVEARRELEDDALGARGPELRDHEDDADHASASR